MGMIRMSFDRDGDADKDRTLGSPYLPHPPPASVTFASPQPSTTRTSSAPRPQSALYTGHSKFHEGSMNDRVSSAPPLHYIGTEEDYKYEVSISRYGGSGGAGGGRGGTGDVRKNGVSPSSRRPISIHEFPSVTVTKSKTGSTKDSIGGRSSNSGSSTSTGKSFFARPWLDTIRTILTGGSNGGGGGKNAVGSTPQKMPASRGAKQSKTPPTSTQGPSQTVRPSREEVLRGYRELKESDFFASRAITSTRQPPPSRAAISLPASRACSRPSSRRPSISAPMPHSFSSNPVSAASLSAALNASSAPSSTAVSFRSSVSSESRVFDTTPRWPLSPRQSMDSAAAAARYATSAASEQHRTRGIKRASTEICSPFDRDDNDDDGDDGDMGKVVKRLKKSASRLSMELSLPSLRRPSQLVSAESSPRKSNRLSRLYPLGNSPLPLVSSHSQSQPHSQPHSQPQPSRSRSEPDIAVPLSPSQNFPTVNVAVDGPAPFPPFTLSVRATHDDSIRARIGHRNIATPTRRKWARTPERINGATAATHRSRRHGIEPLCITPDTNRGIPTVPEIPEQYKQELWAGSRGNENSKKRTYEGSNHQ